MEPEKMVWDFKTKIINEASESKCPEELLSKRSLFGDLQERGEKKKQNTI